jgi:hypothetical protein
MEVPLEDTMVENEEEILCKQNIVWIYSKKDCQYLRLYI